MGQTLTHGVYLPDEGERNCYNGLAANWQLLDNSVGTIAEHTTALAGKAPAVHTHTKSDVADLLNSNFIPSANNSYDLGSSSYQWNNVYAKGYYYNGTPWGLDKLNRWSQSQELRLAALDDYTLPSSEVATEIFTWWGTNNFRGGFGHQYYTNGDEGCRFLLSSKDANNTDHLSAFRFKLNRVGTDSYFYGTGAQNFHLGTSTNKWKTLNGINPGALSLPSGDSINIDTTNWNFSWGINYVTALFDGYIAVACFGSALQINNETKAYAMSFVPGSDGFICGLLPVSTGDSIKVLLTRTQTSQYEGYKLIKLRGNVS